MATFSKKEAEELYVALGSAWELLHMIRDDNPTVRTIINENLVLLENAQNLVYKKQKEEKNG